jgi:hypothetical protein
MRIDNSGNAAAYQAMSAERKEPKVSAETENKPPPVQAKAVNSDSVKISSAAMEIYTTERADGTAQTNSAGGTTLPPPPDKEN